MNKQETLDYLSDRGIPFEIMEHAAVYTMEELKAVALPHPESEAKNLFVRDDKKRYYLITVKGDRRVDLKRFQKEQGTGRLSFASGEDLMHILGLTPGAVTPLGLLNDGERQVTLYLDTAFGDGLIGVHPNDNTASIWLKAADLMRVIEAHGNPVRLVKFEEADGPEEAFRRAAQSIPPGRYRHFKGNEYQVIGIARHSETLEPMVVYRPLYGEGGLWVRPAKMWNETVERDGQTRKRFEKIRDAED